MSNREAFLSMIAKAEGTFGNGDDGYNVIVGGSLFDNDYSDHPRESVWLPHLGISSTAAGRYQITAHYFDAYKRLLDLSDFGHESQKTIASQMIKECRAWDDIDAGRITSAVKKCSSRWASLPGNEYAQRQVKISTLKAYFVDAGGVLDESEILTA